MAKRKFELTEIERKELQKAYQASKDTGTCTHYQTVRLYREGCAEKEIEQITGCSRTSLMKWRRVYRADHSQGLVDHRTSGNSAKLRKLQIEELQQKSHQYMPKELFGASASAVGGQFWTVEDLTHVVREQYNVEYKSHTRTGYFVHSPRF